MNPVQRFLSNTSLAFVARIVAKFSDVLLFVVIARLMGPEDAGVFRLGKTYLTLIVAFSALGLDELLVREIALRRQNSNQYVLNFLVIRLILALLAYGFLALALLFLPLTRTPEATAVILIYSLAIFAEAAYVILETVFIAYERLFVPTLAAIINGAVKLAAGAFFLATTQSIVLTAWAIPLGSSLSILAFILALIRLYRVYPQEHAARLNMRFSLAQLHFIPGFVMIGIFYNINAQQDIFLISLFLTETDLGHYGAAQTVLMGFLMLSAAVRTAVYPLMTRYYTHTPQKLAHFYHKLYQHFIISILPLTAIISLLALPIINLIFTVSYAPAASALRIMIWELLFTFLHIPNARLMLVSNRQKQLGWITGISMLLNLALNIYLLPRYGINAAAWVRTLTAIFAFTVTHLYVQKKLLSYNLIPISIRPLIATILMLLVVWPLTHLVILWPILIGSLVYSTVIIFSGAFNEEDRLYLRQLLHTKDKDNRTTQNNRHYWK